jgi:hypothetical protein
MHIATDFDHDADGCGWARDCTDDDGTENISAALNGNSAIATFNSEGWYKYGADSEECDWDEFQDDDCPKFTTEPYQDDYFISPPMDLTGMENLTIGFTYRGCWKENDMMRLQISKDGVSWAALWNATSDNTDCWFWEALELDEHEIDDLYDYFGSDDTDTVYWRFQAYSGEDETAECEWAGERTPCSVFFIDNIVLRASKNNIINKKY